jgi:hypothetical protein
VGDLSAMASKSLSHEKFFHQLGIFAKNVEKYMAILGGTDVV